MILVKRLNHIKETIPRSVLLGVMGVVLLYVGVAGIVSATSPWWLGKGDAPRHIDYAWSIYNGEMPRYKEGLKYPVFNELRDGAYRTQPAAFHPPLYYALHAPLIGPSLEKGHWQKAIAIGRAFNIFIGIMCIAALAWAGWIFGGSRKEVFAVSVPAIGALFHSFTTLNVNYANDILFILIATLSFIFSYKLIDEGLKLKLILALTALSVLGMATRATYIVFLVTNIIAIMVAAYIHLKRAFPYRILIGTLISSLIFGAVIFTIGWFYYFYNYAVSGDWTRSIPDDSVSYGRPYKTLSMVLTSDSLWGLWYRRFTLSPTISSIISAVGVAGIIGFAIRTKLRSLWTTRSYLFIALLMAIASFGIFATQIFHAVGYGGFYFRYLLPVVLPIALLFAYGLLEPRWAKGQLVTAVAIIMAWTTLFSRAHVASIDNLIPGLYLAVEKNGVSKVVPLLLLIVFGVGCLLLAWSLYRLSSLYRRQAS